MSFVSCLDFDRSGEAMLVGRASGSAEIYCVAKSKILRTLPSKSGEFLSNSVYCQAIAAPYLVMTGT